MTDLNDITKEEIIDAIQKGTCEAFNKLTPEEIKQCISSAFYKAIVQDRSSYEMRQLIHSSIISGIYQVFHLEY